jgi:transposase InsO family protein
MARRTTREAHGLREDGDHPQLALKDLVAYFNHERYHESLENVTPADVYYGRQHQLLSKRAKIGRSTMKERMRL